jgi:type I restriction enzyme M protein
MEPSEYKGYVLAIFFLKYISDVRRDYDDGHRAHNLDNILFIIPQGCSFEELYATAGDYNFSDRINRAFNTIEDVNRDRLHGIFTSLDFNRAANRIGAREFVEQLRQLFWCFNDSHLDLRPSRLGDIKVVGDVYSYLTEKFAKDSGFRGSESYTPQSLLPVMVNILQPKAGKSLYDPTVGTGGMLIAAKQYVGEHEGEGQQQALFGQDISQDAISSSKINLFFHQVFDAHILLGDTLRAPQHIQDGKLKKFDFILSNPPIASQIRQETQWELERDEFRRFSFGIPGRIADFAFLQHIIASLNDNGKAVTIIPSRVLFVSGREGDIRKNIIESDLIEAVISLGPGLLPNTGIPINLLVINKAKTEKRKGKILLINATEQYERAGRWGSYINEQQQKKITDAFISFKEIETFSTIVDLDELRENDFNLMPARYVKLFPINNFLGGKVVWENLSNIADIFQSSTLVRSAEAEGDIPVIRISDLSNQRLSVDDLQKATLPENRERIQYVQTGDILLSRVGTVKSFLVDESLNGAVIDRNLYIIRLKPDFTHLRRYIVELLHSDKGYSLLSRYFIGAAMPQLRVADLRELEIPIPDESVIQLISNIHQVEAELIQRIEKAQDLRTKLFNISDPDEVQKRLDELSTDAHILSSSLVQADTLDYQIRNFYPFPLAFSYRTLSSIFDPVHKYPEQLRVAENILVFLAVTGLTLAQACGVLKAETNTDITIAKIRDYFGGGISPGDWQSFAYFSGKLLRGQRNHAVSESFASLWFKGSGSKESDFASKTKQLVGLKNDYKHDRGPKTPHEFDHASNELQVIIDACYSALSFFIRYPVRLVQAIDMDWQTDQAILDTLVYSGDHPGLRQERIKYPKALPKDKLYLELQPEKWVPLYPHVSVQYCPSCKTRETYFVDRWDGTKVVLKSFERGHTHDSNAEAKQVIGDLERWLSQNLKG